MTLNSRLVREVNRLDASRPCLNPTCTQRVTWSGARGRPSFFCRPACRVHHYEYRQRLKTLLEAADHELLNAELRGYHRDIVEGLASKLRWLLNWYPADASRS